MSTQAMEQEILLIRHGKPASATNDMMGARDFARWVKRYNHSPLDPASYPRKHYDLSTHYVVSSGLKRAQLSAKVYGITRIDAHNPLLNEMDIPYYRLGITLRAWHWVVLNRALWMAGWRGNFESFREAKHRAKTAALWLEETVESKQKVAVFGHGMSNRYIRMALEKRGWLVREKDNAYWGVNRLTRQAGLPINNNANNANITQL
ncbi:histidine phosphatase family protein [Alteromonas sp. H39]|uniref:histidine phosphatase family protein n=1 Tax=Alteromonas sp. H39 TaxID=3389876 RepID=UPI0039E08899